MKVSLERRPQKTEWKPPLASVKSCQPFVENSRGVLIHRPKSVDVHRLWDDRDSHISIGYWCGNHCCGLRNFTFLSAPPDDRLVCAACEEKAINSGLRSSDQLAGKHVHKGLMKAIQACCGYRK